MGLVQLSPDEVLANYTLFVYSLYRSLQQYWTSDKFIYPVFSTKLPQYQSCKCCQMQQSVPQYHLGNTSLCFSWFSPFPKVEILKALKEVWTNTPLWTLAFIFMSTLYSRTVQSPSLAYLDLCQGGAVLGFPNGIGSLIFFLPCQLAKRSHLFPVHMALVMVSYALASFLAVCWTQD